MVYGVILGLVFGIATLACLGVPWRWHLGMLG